MAGSKILKIVMALESWILVVKCCLLMKPQNSTVNYSMILWNSTNYFQPRFTVLMKLDSFGNVCPTAFQLVQVKSMLKVSNYTKTE